MVIPHLKKNLFFRDEVPFSSTSGFIGCNCPRNRYHWFYIYIYIFYLYICDLQIKLFPFATVTYSFEETLSISIPSPPSSEEELIIQQWSDICTCLSKCKVCGANVAACDLWWIFKGTQALPIKPHSGRTLTDPLGGAGGPFVAGGAVPVVNK